MSLASDLWRRLGGAPDPRSDREIAGDIDDELAFHLEQRERELVASGVAPETARAQALERFGNIERVRAECRRVQLGGILMLQRISLVVIVVLVGVVAWLTFQSVSSQRAARAEIQALRAELAVLADTLGEKDATGNASRNLDASNRLIWNAPILNFPTLDMRRGAARGNAEEATSEDEWIRRFAAAAGNEEGTEKQVGLLVRECSEARAPQVLRAIWPKVAPAQRMSLLNAFGNGSDEQTARLVIHFGATDDNDHALAARAFELLREVALVEFDVEHVADYLAWHGANKDLGISEIVEKTAPALVKKLSMFSAWNDTCARYSPLAIHSGLSAASATREALRRAGAVELIQKWARFEDPRARVAAVQWMAAVQIDEVTARMIVMPMFSDPNAHDTALVTAICSALVDLECTWAAEPLLLELGRIMRTKDRDLAQLEAVGSALAHMDAEAVVPTILAWIVWTKTPATVKLLGETALHQLTGVEHEATHDADWWLNWWSIHRKEYPNADTETGLPRVFTW